ncbi:hypothetical protein [Bradyrhizobium sp. Cp5.3]|uniref:hypothetical protein n=1 Tax=Bradyrhizobium sp. Cp5.3 TaxID=443598 RepID=UPI0004894517|nr:hypothetical protein [Bradyrhizobium sp. Cp5.3]
MARAAANAGKMIIGRSATLIRWLVTTSLRVALTLASRASAAWSDASRILIGTRRSDVRGIISIRRPRMVMSVASSFQIVSRPIDMVARWRTILPQNAGSLTFTETSKLSNGDPSQL